MTQQFTATVDTTGSGVSQSVTWQVTGDGTVSASGLFTAGSSAGTATIMAISNADNTTSGTAAVTVTQSTAFFGKWSGTLTSPDGTQSTPVDFNLQQTGTSLTATGKADDVLSIWDGVNPPTMPPCTNENLPFGPVDPYAGFSGQSLSGNINGSNITLSYVIGSTVPDISTYSLTGTLGTGNASITGTFQNPDLNFACFPYMSGTVAFTQYAALNETVTGSVTYGTAQVPITIAFNEGNFSSLTIGSVPSLCSPQTWTMILKTYGRYFYMAEDNVTDYNYLVVWGVMNDPNGQSVNAYVESTGAGQNCFSPTSPVEATLQKQ